MTLLNIKVKNFQSIPKGEVELGKFTVFTGPSSSGKSAFMRAAQATVRNSFNPSQVRQGSKETHVTMEFDNCTVEAIRGKSKSTYVLDGKEFTKAGRQVPEPVAESIRMNFISDTESSFSTQFDKPYLIAEPGSTAAKVLGSLTNVSILHGGLKESNRRVLETNAKVKTLKTSLDENLEVLKEFEYLDGQRELLIEAGDLLGRVKTQSKVTEELESLSESINANVQKLKEIQKSKFDMQPIMDSMDQINRVVDSVTYLESRLNSIDVLMDSRPTWDFDKVPSEGFPEELGSVEELHSVVDRIERMKSQLPQWDYRSLDGIEVSESIDSLSNELIHMVQLMETISNNVRRFKDIKKTSGEIRDRKSVV